MVFTLFKIRMQSVLSGFFGKKFSKGKPMTAGKKVLLTILLLYVAAVLIGAISLMCFQLCVSFTLLDLAWLYFAIVGILAFLLCFIGSIFTAGNQLYNSKDNELLMAMPIKPESIILSRMLILLAENFVYSLIVFVPAGVVWCILCPVTFSGVVCFVLAAIALPLMSLTLSCILGWLIALVSSKMRNKTLITTIIYIGFFAAYMLVCSNLGEYIERLSGNGQIIADAIKNAVFPMYHFGIAAAEGNFISLLLFLLCSVLPFAIVFTLLRKNFIRIATANKGAAKRRYTEKKLKTSSALLSAMKKELRHFISSPIYILNSGIGAVLMVIFAVYALVAKDSLIAILAALPGGNTILPGLCCVVLCFCTSMVMISAPSVSLEGKNLWLIKSLPIKTSDILHAKALCHIAATLPFSFASGIVCAIASAASPLGTVGLIFLPSVLAVFGGYYGLFINLKFPKFDWISEAHCIKQGISTLVFMLSGMATIVVISVVGLALFRVISIDIYMIIASVFFSCLTFLLILWLNRRGTKVFDSL